MLHFLRRHTCSPLLGCVTCQCGPGAVTGTSGLRARATGRLRGGFHTSALPSLLGGLGPCSPPRVPSHPNGRGLEAGSCIPHAGSSKSCVGRSSVQGSWSGQEVAPGGESPAGSREEGAWGRRHTRCPCPHPAPCTCAGWGSWWGKRVLGSPRLGSAGRPLWEHLLHFRETTNAFGVFFQLKVLFWNDFTFTEKLQNGARAPVRPAPSPVDMSQAHVHVTAEHPALPHH